MFCYLINLSNHLSNEIFVSYYNLLEISNYPILIKCLAINTIMLRFRSDIFFSSVYLDSDSYIFIYLFIQYYKLPTFSFAIIILIFSCYVVNLNLKLNKISNIMQYNINYII